MLKSKTNHYSSRVTKMKMNDKGKQDGEIEIIFSLV